MPLLQYRTTVLIGALAVATAACSSGGDGDTTTRAGSSGTSGSSGTGATADLAPEAIRDIDFSTFSYPADSCGDIFHEQPSDGYAVVDSQASSGAPADEDFYSVAIRDEITYGDLTGDGVEESLVIVECSPGNRPYGFASVWSPTGDGTPERLAVVRDNEGTDPGRGEHRLLDAALVDSGVQITWQVFGPGAEPCCPTETATVTLVWQDGGLVAAAPAEYNAAISQ